jgi:hypothetical protein
MQLLIRFLNVLQGVEDKRQVSYYHSVWQDLSQLIHKMGDSFCYMYGTIVVIWFATLTLSLYGSLTGILDHGFNMREVALLANGALCTSVLFVICDAGQRVSEEVSFTCLLSIVHLSKCNNFDLDA